MPEDRTILVEGSEPLPASTGNPETSESRVPLYQRDIFPRNLTLSERDLYEFFRLISEANFKARKLEYANLNLDKFDSPQDAQRTVDDALRVEYTYRRMNDESVGGIDSLPSKEVGLPEDLKNLFVSNTTYVQKGWNLKPLNSVDAFLGFEKPSLKIDFVTMPSNPTENRSVINVQGRDEDWVISTTDRIQKFFASRQARRPVIHGSGVYDTFIYLAFLPILITCVVRWGGDLAQWADSKGTFVSLFVAIYALLLSLLFARFFFQYIRWLFPPMEYYKNSRVGAMVHRWVASVAISTVALAALYDLIKYSWSVSAF